jgi:hypothetical protein
MGKNYSHMSCEERTMIQLSLEQGFPIKQRPNFHQRTLRSHALFHFYRAKTQLPAFSLVFC